METFIGIVVFMLVALAAVGFWFLVLLVRSEDTVEVKEKPLNSKKSRNIKKTKRKRKLPDSYQEANKNEINFWKGLDNKTTHDFTWNGEVINDRLDKDFNVVSFRHEVPILAYKANLYKQKCSCPDFRYRAKSSVSKNQPGRFCKHLKFLFSKLEDGKLDEFEKKKTA